MPEFSSIFKISEEFKCKLLDIATAILVTSADQFVKADVLCTLLDEVVEGALEYAIAYLLLMQNYAAGVKPLEQIKSNLMIAPVIKYSDSDWSSQKA